MDAGGRATHGAVAEGLVEILLDKSPTASSLCSPPFSKGEVILIKIKVR